MSALARRIEKLEAGRQIDASGIAAMGGDELRNCVRDTLEALGGPEVALIAMRAAGTDAKTIKMVEDWPAWPL